MSNHSKAAAALLNVGGRRSLRRRHVNGQAVAGGQEPGCFGRAGDVPAEDPVEGVAARFLGVRDAGLVKGVGAQQVVQFVAVRPA